MAYCIFTNMVPHQTYAHTHTHSHVTHEITYAHPDTFTLQKQNLMSFPEMCLWSGPKNADGGIDAKPCN